MTTRADQISLGTSASTYTAAGIGTAASRATQSGALQVLTTDANGNIAGDGGALQTQVDGHGTAITALQGQVSTNTTNVTNLTTTVTGLQTQTNTNTTNITNLQGTVGGCRRR